MEEKRKDKRAKTHLGFAEWFDTKRKPFGKTLKDSLAAIIGIPLCIVIAYFLCLMYIGDGAYSYSDTDYLVIENAIDNCVSGDIGIDILTLQKQVDEYVLKSSDDGNVELSCTIKEGHFFKATVTAELSTAYEVKEKERNYKSMEEYMQKFWLTFGAAVLIVGVGGWFLVECLWNGILVLVFAICKEAMAFRDKKSGKNPNPDDTHEDPKAEGTVLHGDGIASELK